MLGCALACLEKGEWADARWRNGLALAGVGLLATGAALLSNAKPFPGWWALLPTLGAAALIAAGPRAWVNRTILAHLHQLGVGAVVLLGPVPQWREFLYKVVQRAYDGEPPIRATQYRDENIIRTDQLLHQRFGASRDVVFVSLIDRLCNGEGCLVYVDGDPLDGLTTYDYGHFTLRTSEYVARTVLAPLIRRLMP